MNQEEVLALVLDTLDREGMFNVIHLETGFKVDLIFRRSGGGVKRRSRLSR